MRPVIAGYVGGILWGLLVLIPSVGAAIMRRFTDRQEYRKARKLAEYLRWLHPADDYWRELPKFYSALELAQGGAVTEATEILSQYTTASSAMTRVAALQLYRMNGQWEELKAWIEANITERELRKDVYTLTYLLRALGEVGDLNGVVNFFDRSEKDIERAGQRVFRDQCRMFVLAFCGRQERLARSFRGPFAFLPQPIKEYWLATADMAIGNVEQGRDKLRSILEICDPLTRMGVERRLTHSVALANEVLTPAAGEILLRLERELDDEERYGERQIFGYKKAYATFSLIGLNSVVFGLEMLLGGNEDGDTLFRMGGLVPSVVTSGQWWRLGAAMFLHLGFLHLFINMIALYYFGCFVEFALGWRRYAVCYFAAGLGSMLTIVLLTMTGLLTNCGHVGASGAIMGLVGVGAAVFLRGWRLEKTSIALKRLLEIALILLLQILFDVTTPRVSFAGHCSGFVIGFAVASLMRHPLSDPNKSATAPQ